MSDIVDPATRSRMMAGIKCRDTKAEVAIRKRLFAYGFRYRLHDRKLPGKPDMVFPKYNAVIFFNGCFWHAHDCELFKWPSTRVGFWRKKLLGNRETDIATLEKLKRQGWRIFIVWECSFRGPGKKRGNTIDSIVGKAAKWLISRGKAAELKG